MKDLDLGAYGELESKTKKFVPFDIEVRELTIQNLQRLAFKRRSN